MSVEMETAKVLRNWIADVANGLAAYIDFYLQKGDTTVLTKIRDVYLEFRQIFGV